ncbi:uncharacterized protein PSANT_02605 [Moesziomyces antarcticus]|nr:uncharacterized protein PSANT_02605 [Moesziomyces antarcticus]
MDAKSFLVVADPSVIELFTLLSGCVSYNPELREVVERDMSEPSTVKIYCDVIVACLPMHVSPEWTPRDDYPPNKTPFIQPVQSSLIPLIEALFARIEKFPRLLKAIEYQMYDPICHEKVADTMVAMVQFSMRKTPLVIDNIRARSSFPAATHSGDTSTNAAT